LNLTDTRLEVSDGIATVTLYRPEQMNAFTPTMALELIEVFAEADKNDAVRVVVVTGAGKAFCAGADLSYGASTFDISKREGKEIPISQHRDRGGKVALAIFNCRKPVMGNQRSRCRSWNYRDSSHGYTYLAAADAKIGFVFATRRSAGSLLVLVSASHRRHLKTAELSIHGPSVRAEEERLPDCSITYSS
jgi:enoyl-CoA hydratase/carnithine racemase